MCGECTGIKLPNSQVELTIREKSWCDTSDSGFLVHDYRSFSALASDLSAYLDITQRRNDTPKGVIRENFLMKGNSLIRETSTISGIKLERSVGIKRRNNSEVNCGGQLGGLLGSTGQGAFGGGGLENGFRANSRRGNYGSQSRKGGLYGSNLGLGGNYGSTSSLGGSYGSKSGLGESYGSKSGLGGSYGSNSGVGGLSGSKSGLSAIGAKIGTRNGLVPCPKFENKGLGRRGIGGSFG